MIISCKKTIVTAGSNYLDIDSYACMVALTELLQLQGKNSVAFANAPANYSVHGFFQKEKAIQTVPVSKFPIEDCDYIIVDVSNPEFISDKIPLDHVVAVYDHHIGFNNYWEKKIGNGAHIEFIGAAATLIYREWKKAGLADKMPSKTGKLLIAAILDNTLNLTSSMTTQEDIDAFNELCKRENVGKDWCASYFSEVQLYVEANLENALFGDIKNIRNNCVLPRNMGQIAVWNAKCILHQLSDIRRWFDARYECWMLNIIDIQQNCNYFVCDSKEYQKKIEAVFDVHFELDIAKTSMAYLRKEIIEKAVFKSSF